MDDVEFSLRTRIEQLQLEAYQMNARVTVLEKENKQLKDSLQNMALHEKPKRRKGHLATLRWEYYHAHKSRIKTENKLAIMDWREVKSICDREFLNIDG